MEQQLKLFDIQEMHSYQCSDYVVLENNRHTYNLLMNNDIWQSFILYGPLGSGKTHLAHVWKKLRSADFLLPNNVDTSIETIKGSSAVIVEDIDKINNESWLLHCYNFALEKARPLLMTSSMPPKLLPLKLKDLQSRLLATLSAKLAEPNEELLRIMLVKLFTDRQLHTDIKTINFILNNVERSFVKLRDIVSLIDTELQGCSGSVTIPFVRSVIRKVNLVQGEGAQHCGI
ncbi:chromosomal DNA replication initiator [Anaplasma platys]|uniref:Chromosomal DNA replication initiator n=1 Tax=Anaplasma platys TaxID=949 RepID=A0A858PYU0_9RICK|nr:DnaA/Hda family protein [Anaplasma platys]QJC27765.1 chromosomal DNA replication initiator [Anaplasma platys]